MKDYIIKVIISITFVAGGTIFGVIVDWLLKERVAKLAKKTSVKIDDIFVETFGRKVILLCFLFGIYLGIFFLPIPENYRSLLFKTVVSVFIVVITSISANFIAQLTESYALKIGGGKGVSILKNVIKITVIIIGVLILFQYIGISITPMLTALGLGGLAVALAFQDTLANLFAGIYIFVSRQFKPGDYIKLEGGEEGYVVDITWRTTRIRTLQNNIVVIPNSKLSSTIVTNYHMPYPEVAVLIDVGVSYSSDLEKVERVTIEVAKEVMREVKGGVPEFEPFIRYHTFGESSINFTVVMRAKEFADQYLVKHEFIKRLHKRYKEEGIEIPFPVRTLYHRKG